MAASFRPLLNGLVIYALLVALELTGILWLNGGAFTYTLDDAYIHLALAENIAAGHYGINVGESSAPSSSILWPFLLAPALLFSHTSLVPLVFNVIAAGATLVLFWRLAATTLDRIENNRDAVITLLVVLFMLGTNLVGLVFTGMEHSLQLLGVVAIVLGLVGEARNGRIAWWLGPVVVAAPLVRYENLAVSVPALIYLFLRRHRVVALISLGVMSAVMAGFSMFLRSLDLGWLPTSVTVKSRVVESGGSLASVLFNLIESLKDPRGILLAVALVGFAAVGLSEKRDRAERLLAGTIGLGLVLHLLVGRYGWYSRYEVYIWASALLAGIYLARQTLVRFFNRRRHRTMLMASGATLLICSPYVYALLTTPLASRNIHEQHGQMHRLVTDHYQRPIAANDIGYVSFRNDAYVLDIAGMGSQEVLRARRDGTPGWLDALSEEHDVRLAVVYAHRMPDDAAGWVELGELHLGGRRITAAHEVVAVYLREGEDPREVLMLLKEWEKELPAGVRFIFTSS